MKNMVAFLRQACVDLEAMRVKAELVSYAFVPANELSRACIAVSRERSTN